MTSFKGAREVLASFADGDLSVNDMLSQLSPLFGAMMETEGSIADEMALLVFHDAAEYDLDFISAAQFRTDVRNLLEEWE